MREKGEKMKVVNEPILGRWEERDVSAAQEENGREELPDGFCVIASAIMAQQITTPITKKPVISKQ